MENNDSECNYSELVQSASGGILLKGVCPDSLSESSACRQTVADIKRHINLKSPWKIYMHYDKKFRNKQEMQEFEKKITDFGMAGAINFSGTLAIANRESNASLNYENQNKNDGCVSTSLEREVNVTYNIVPTALWESSLADFSLSTSAIEDLIYIEKSLAMLETEADTLCRNFFDKFGTHIIVGNVHFGGIKIKHTSNIDEKTETKFVDEKKKNIKGSISGKGTILLQKVEVDSSLSMENEASKEMLRNTKFVSNCFEQFYIGGPKNCQSDEEWKKKLLEQSSTWAVIDRDVTKDHNFEPVWKLILHDLDSFEDPKKLADYIRKRMPSESTQIEFVVYEEKSLKTTIDSLHRLLKSDVSEEKCIICITQLLQEIINLEHNSVWENILKNYHAASEIMLFTTQHVRTAQHEIDLRRCLRNILNHSQGVKFNHRIEVVSWLNKSSKEKQGKLPDIDIVDVKGLIDWLEKENILKIAQALPEYDIERDHCLTNVLCKAISVLISKIWQQSFHSDYLLLLAALMPFDFDYQEGSFRTQMTMHKIEQFLKYIKKVSKTYDDLAAKSMVVQHAWVLHLLLFNVKEMSNMEATDLSQLIEEVLTNKIKLEKSVVTIIKDNKGFKGIQTELQKLLEDDKDKVLCWNFFSRKPLIPDSESLMDTSTPAFPTIPNTISNILQAMEFLQFYPQKLTLQKVLEIDENTYQKPKCLKDIPFSVLKKIISCNSKFREKVLNEFLLKTPRNVTSIFDSDDEGSDHEDVNSENDNWHPLDLFYCIYLCCDPFLKGTLCKKIAEVQLAIPLVYPYAEDKLMFSLWPLRKVFIGDQVDTMARSCFNSVCFLRIGNVSFMSKSKLINEFMREQNVEHNTFFNTHCPLGLKPRKAYNGVIEISCYIPSESDPNTIKDGSNNEETSGTIAGEIDNRIFIFNLRGDVNDYPKQAELILQMSNIIVVLVEFSCINDKKIVDTMKKIHQSGVKVIIVTNNSTDLEYKDLVKTFKEYKRNANVTASRTLPLFTTDPKTKERKNAVSIKEELITNLKTFLDTSEGIVLENIAKNAPEFVVVDEFERNSELGRKEAVAIITKIREMADGRLDKTIAMPLQGRALWQEWSNQQKQLYNTEKSRSDDEVERLMTSMLTIRKRQTDICNSETNIMADFVDKILCCDENMEKVLFFISWLQEYLDSESRKVLPEKIERVLQAYELFRSGHLKEADVKRAEENLSNASFGLEIFFREIGQIYECYLYCALEGGYMIEPSTSSVIQNLPRAVAKLLISGRAFEIMDGDAVNIPTNWMGAVFKELEILIGNKKIFSLSVVGVQSSGKSTLLNSMFGLEFPVRSGRCTRGVFLHILPVTKKNIDFDYAFVFDTEGLNSHTYGLGRTKHDNKLATLAIGLADTVIINIMGETIGENMENTLEIVIHALMRLKQANNHIELSQSCTFVHQNVSKTGKGLELKPDMQRMYQKLDEVTKEVAIHEHLDYIGSFNDVISFDVERDVLHVPNIFQGHPPMAPVSQKYSESIEKIAEHILMHCSKKKSHLTISDTCDLIESVWKGILAENFVFSFRNCLEVKAYNLLETKFKGLTWEIEKMSQTFWTDNARQRLHKCTESTIDSEECSLGLEFTRVLNEHVNLAKENLCKFIDESELCDHMVHWKGGKLNELTESSERLRNTIENKIKQAVGYFKVRLKNDEMGSEEKIMQRVSDYAKGLKGKNVSEEEKQNMFQELWMTSLNELAPNFPIFSHAQKKKELLTKMINVLYEEFASHTTLLEKKLGNFVSDENFGLSDLFVDVKDIDDECINVRSNWRKFQKIFIDVLKDYKQKTFTVTKQIYQTVSRHLNDLHNQDVECDETHFRHILNQVTSNFQEIDYEDREFSVTYSFRIKVAIHVAKFSFSQFSDINRRCEEKHSLYSFLQSKKSQAKRVFFDILQEKADAEIVANYLCSEFKKQLKANISISMFMLVKERMLECFAFLKSKMITEIMSELAEKDNFDEYMDYINNPEVYVKAWIRRKTRCECFERKGDQYSFFVRMAEKILSTDVSHIIYNAKRVTEGSDITTLEDWIQCLCDSLYSSELDRGYASIFSKYQVRDLKSFCEIFTTQISEVEAELLNTYTNADPDDIEWEGNTPYEEIFQSLWGCLEHCPLCLEPCQYTDEDHWREDNIPHMCVQHRPFALGGIFFHENDELMTETCNFAIRSNFCRRCGEWCNCPTKNYDNFHSLKKYKTFIPSWDIQPSIESEGSHYWCWFTAKYATYLALYFAKEPPQIPKRWYEISKEKALNSLCGKQISRNIWFERGTILFKDSSNDNKNLLFEFGNWLNMRYKKKLKVVRLFVGKANINEEKVKATSSNRYIVLVIDEFDVIEETVYHNSGNVYPIICKLFKFPPVESAKVTSLEQDIKLDYTLYSTFRKSIRNISRKLFENHSNLEMISASSFRSKKNGDNIVLEPCIVLYCSCKGIIPL